MVAVAASSTLSLAVTGRAASATTPSPPPNVSAIPGVAEPSGPLCAAMAAEGEGSISGMADDPAATAVSSNPLLSRLAAMVTATGLDDTLSEGPLTIFAPINSAFDKIDPSTLEGLLADTDVLTGILMHHVIPEELSSADLIAGVTFVTAHGHDAAVTVSMVGETLVINGGQAAVLCADVPTANATIYLIDTVLTPPPETGDAVQSTAAAIETTAPTVEATEPDVETTAQAPASTEPDAADGGQIEFAEGASEASVDGTTTNQSFDSWSVAGQTGQLLEVNVSAADGNVTFDIFSTEGEVLANDQTSASVQLPADGLYAIEVGTGANSADYTLNVAVTG
jgi:uncharacterized surface protein with fasciclin (FAS1) repeats